MAKQTFTTGQVLTAAQMTALQLNDYNQTVSAKVASYVLVAADAGTRITMSNAGATTITVNTSLFTAADTLFITNIGAGACTITAGTATVSTASSLVLAQYDSGRLYFTSTGVAIWEKYQGAAASSGGMTQLDTGSLTGATPSISSISGSYKHLELWVTDPYGSGANIINIRFNSDSGANYARQLIFSGNTPTVAGTSAATSIATYNGIITSANQNGYFRLILPFYSTTVSAKNFQFFWSRDAGGAPEQLFGNYYSTSAISSIQFFLDGGSTFTGGTYTLYGVN